MRPVFEPSCLVSPDLSVARSTWMLLYRVVLLAAQSPAFAFDPISVHPDVHDGPVRSATASPCPPAARAERL
jgi:hypothetical protein